MAVLPFRNGQKRSLCMGERNGIVPAEQALSLSKPFSKAFGSTLVNGNLDGYFAKCLLCVLVFEFQIPLGYTVGGELEAYCIAVGG